MIVVSLMLIMSACSNNKDEKGSNIKQSKFKSENKPYKFKICRVYFMIFNNYSYEIYTKS